MCFVDCFPNPWTEFLSGLLLSTTNQKRYQDLGSARHQYGISALVTQTSFCEGSSGDLARRRLFSQAIHRIEPQYVSEFFMYLVSNLGTSKQSFPSKGQPSQRLV